MKRSNRLVALTNFFIDHPKVHRQLSFFTHTYGASKSSISEDLDITDGMLKHEGAGYLRRIPGATGGVRYIPYVSQAHSTSIIRTLCEQLEDPSRLVPAEYIYMGDILGAAMMEREIGPMFATTFLGLKIDVVMTIETKGIPLAYAVANHLNVPVVIVRRDPKVVEGSSVNINYVSASSRKIQTMVLTKQSLQEGAHVCIIDDFMKAGGTINVMKSLLAECKAKVQASGVLAEVDDEADDRIVDDYTSLVKIANIDRTQEHVEVSKGNVQIY